MEQLKKIIKRSLRASIIILIYGILIRNPVVYIGMFVSSLVSVLTFYMLCLETESILFSNNIKRNTFISYGKRYLLYLLTFLVMGYFGGLQYIAAAAIGLFNIRFNIFIIMIQTKISKLKYKKNNRGGKI
ncbi:MAG: ATPase [Fusobacterium sp. JB021]|nr:ATPase [Fusobacterium sp. JB021]MDP0505622.1 ATPase [Fusobacterium sp. JB019]